MKKLKTNPHWQKLTYSVEEAATKLTATVEDIEDMIAQGLLRIVYNGQSRSIPVVDLSEHVNLRAE